jgi:hypothetical protein
MTVTVTDLFAAAYCLTQGVELVGALPGRFVRIQLNDTQGKATARLDEWYNGEPLVDAQEFATRYRQVCGLVRANKG